MRCKFTTLPKHWAHFEVAHCENVLDDIVTVVHVRHAGVSRKAEGCLMIRLNWTCVKVKASIVGAAMNNSPAPFPSPSISRTRSASLIYYLSPC